MAKRKHARNTRLVAIVATLALVMGLNPLTAFAGDPAPAENPLDGAEASATSAGTPSATTSTDETQEGTEEQQKPLDQQTREAEPNGQTLRAMSDDAPEIESAGAGITPQASEAKEIFIDNTTDNSKSFVEGAVHITGSGAQAGYNPTKTVYDRAEVAVTYSNPKTAAVQSKIDEAWAQAAAAAESVKERGKSGEYHMPMTTSTLKVWDNRTYTTQSDGDAVLIGDADYLQGAYGVNDNYTVTHIASGDHGKNTLYRIEANGYVQGFGIKVSDDGFGTGKADYEESLAEETITLTATPNDGSEFLRWEVVSGDVAIADATSATTTFTMPKADVEVKATFTVKAAPAISETDDAGKTHATNDESSAASANNTSDTKSPASSKSASPKTGDSALPIASALLLAACSGIVLAAASRRMREPARRGRHSRL